ncbi:MAG: histidine kinase [Treponema sp.]|nr:histidine kinase [Treponema sp.]MCL2126653.1 histidine kinase [Treponema sp.]
MMVERRSIGSKVMLYNVIIITLISGLIVINYVSNRSFSGEYSKNADLYRELGLFYREMRNSSYNAENFFYAMDSVLLLYYRNSMNAASRCLDNIESLVHDPELRFRFRLLRNMMDSCNELFEKILQSSGSRPSYEGNYRYLIYLFELTDNTQRDYYSYLVNYTESCRTVLKNSWRRLTLAVSFIVTGIIFAAVVFSVNFSRWVTRPINIIVSNIQKIKKGEYDLSKVKIYGPEFSILGEAFDEMTVSIRQNIQSIETNARLRGQLLEAENENLRIREQLAKSEIKTLQDQMNPHFLFNTLSMITQIAGMENARQTAELMETTINLLRYSLDKSNHLSTLYEELECVRNYIHIQQLRFGDRINFELAADPQVPNVLLPGMLLQPLIENAVLHGVGEMVQGAMVNVSVSRRNGILYLTVEDNGKGIKDEKIEELLSGDFYPSKTPLERNHFGLASAKKRIEILYGKSANFHIESTEDVGTLITISITADGSALTSEGEYR